MTLLAPDLAQPWLVADLGGPQRVLSFAPWRAGFVTTRRIVWREVRNADLTPELDVRRWIAGMLAERGLSDAVTMLTSHDIRRFVRTEREVEGIRAAALATVGLGNAERVGQRHFRAVPEDTPGYGTINIAVQVAGPDPRWGLSRVAQIEALTIAAQARTAAVMEAGLNLPGGRVTGTGTDCLALAAPPGREAFAGLHTALGEAVGAAVHAAVREGARDWIARNGGLSP